MTDIRALRHALKPAIDTSFRNNLGDVKIPAGLAMQIDDALREQEPVKPEFDSLDGNVGRWRCGNCQVSLGAVRPPYCWHCGRKVKWE